MAIWGVSRSDVINSGRNTAVGLGVLAGCAVAAYAVKKLATMAFATMNQDSRLVKEKYALYSRCLGAAGGLAVAFAAYKLIPGSGFALITGDSTSTMLKVGTVLASVGFLIDYFVDKGSHTATVVGFGGAVATRFGYPVLGVLGALGAALGSGFIPNANAANKAQRFKKSESE